MFQKTLNFFLIIKIFLLIFNCIIYPVKAKEFYELKIPDEINIHLSKKNFGKYLQYQMEALSDGSNEDKKNILRKYKKSIKAKLSINGELVDSKISITGDWKDHLRFPHTSLKVEILGENNFYNVKKFKLFLPETRFAENEIFWTLILKKIGFPVFHTKRVHVSLNNNKYIALFQEDASKEFLERNGFRETAIIRNDDFHFFHSDEDVTFYNSSFSRSWLIDNENFIKKDNPYATKITSKAIANYSNSDFFKRVKDNNLFELILGKYAPHGLVHFNRKFIYEPYYNQFTPLYYDGMPSTIYKYINEENNECQYFSSYEELNSFIKEYKELSSFDLDNDKKCIFHEIITKKEFYVNNLIDEHFFDEAQHNGYQNQYKQHFEISKIIRENINIKELNKSNFISNDTNNYIYTFQYLDRYYLSLYNNDSKKVKFSAIKLEEYNKYISKNNIYQNSGRFVINLGLIDNKINEKNDIKINTKNKNLYLTEPKTYKVRAKDLKLNEYNIFFKNSQARLLIYKDTIENKTLNFFNDENLNNNNLYKISRFNDDLLTGCITIIDAKISNLNLNINDMFCEDAINIIRSEGDINNLNIYDSTFDALDLDYSMIKINNSEIFNAGNDCIDLSFGNYHILNAFLKDCMDKGFSVGEKSITKINNAFLSKTNIGIAAKDESKVFIEELKAINTQLYCLAAYTKKSEFNGASIRYKSISCDKNNYSDDKSMIIYEKN